MYTEHRGDICEVQCHPEDKGEPRSEHNISGKVIPSICLLHTKKHVKLFHSLIFEIGLLPFCFTNGW